MYNFAALEELKEKIMAIQQKNEDLRPVEQCLVNESAVSYQRRESDSGVTRMTTRKELETECFSLEESKNRLVEKIHRHFHRQL